MTSQENRRGATRTARGRRPTTRRRGSTQHELNGFREEGPTNILRPHEPVGVRYMPYQFPNGFPPYPMYQFPLHQELYQRYPIPPELNGVHPKPNDSPNNPGIFENSNMLTTYVQQTANMPFGYPGQATGIHINQNSRRYNVAPPSYSASIQRRRDRSANIYIQPEENSTQNSDNRSEHRTQNFNNHFTNGTPYQPANEKPREVPSMQHHQFVNRTFPNVDYSAANFVDNRLHMAIPFQNNSNLNNDLRSRTFMERHTVPMDVSPDLQMSRMRYNDSINSSSPGPSRTSVTLEESNKQTNSESNISMNEYLVSNNYRGQMHSSAPLPIIDSSHKNRLSTNKVNTVNSGDNFGNTVVDQNVFTSHFDSNNTVININSAYKNQKDKLHTNDVNGNYANNYNLNQFTSFAHDEYNSNSQTVEQSYTVNQNTHIQKTNENYRLMNGTSMHGANINGVNKNFNMYNYYTNSTNRTTDLMNYNSVSSSNNNNTNGTTDVMNYNSVSSYKVNESSDSNIQQKTFNDVLASTFNRHKEVDMIKDEQRSKTVTTNHTTKSQVTQYTDSNSNSSKEISSVNSDEWFKIFDEALNVRTIMDDFFENEYKLPRLNMDDLLIDEKPLIQDVKIKKEKISDTIKMEPPELISNDTGVKLENSFTSVSDLLDYEIEDHTNTVNEQWSHSILDDIVGCNAKNSYENFTYLPSFAHSFVSHFADRHVNRHSTPIQNRSKMSFSPGTVDFLDLGTNSGMDISSIGNDSVFSSDSSQSSRLIIDEQDCLSILERI